MLTTVIANVVVASAVLPKISPKSELVKMSLVRYTLSVLLLVAVALAMRKQGVAVKGTLKCGNIGANYTKVRIVDIDYGLDPDDTLDEKRTDETGTFSLTGTTHELTPIDPVLYIWHECKDEATPCSRKLKFIIPKKYIHGGEPTAEQWVDIGVLNLEGSFEKEERECTN